ncbi:hypothetical protein ACOSQ4_010919 [Xanthoceras sorbifolium]
MVLDNVMTDEVALHLPQKRACAKINDRAGVVLVSYTSLLLGLVSSDIGEALAILLGLRLAIDMGWSTVCVESDAASVVKQLSSRVTSCSDIGLILDDILSLVVNFADLSFSSVGRSANRVAHDPIGNILY